MFSVDRRYQAKDLDGITPGVFGNIRRAKGLNKMISKLDRYEPSLIQRLDLKDVVIRRKKKLSLFNKSKFIGDEVKNLELLKLQKEKLLKQNRRLVWSTGIGVSLLASTVTFTAGFLLSPASISVVAPVAAGLFGLGIIGSAIGHLVNSWRINSFFRKLERYISSHSNEIRYS